MKGFYCPFEVREERITIAVAPTRVELSVRKLTRPWISVEINHVEACKFTQFIFFKHKPIETCIFVNIFRSICIE